MKKLLLLTGLVIFTSFLTLRAQIAQNIDLYCTGNDTTGGQTVNPTFYKIDAFSATAIAVNSLQNEVYGIQSGSSTFDHSNHHYIFSGNDTSHLNRVYTLDTLGNIISNPVPQEEYIVSNLQYDLKNQVFYSTIRDTSVNITYFGTVNPSNGSTNLMNIISDEIYGISLGNTTLNSNTGKYILYGSGPGGADDRRLFIINAQNGTIESNILANNCYLGSLQYDNQRNKLYGFYRDTSDLFLSYFAEIDTLDASVTILNCINDEVSAVLCGSSVYDQTTGYFIFKGKDTSLVDKLFVINSETGQIISDSPIFGTIGFGIECDNTNFAKSFYNTSSITEEKATLYNLTIYPNPSKGTFRLNFYVEKPENIIIQVINDLGQNVYKQEHKKFKGNYSREIDISSLKNGIYMLNIKVGENTYTKSISVVR